MFLLSNCCLLLKNNCLADFLYLSLSFPGLCLLSMHSDYISEACSFYMFLSNVMWDVAFIFLESCPLFIML